MLIAVGSVGIGGGLALFWKDTFDVSLINFSLRYIHVQVKPQSNSLSWIFTDFYDHTLTN